MQKRIVFEKRLKLTKILIVFISLLLLCSCTDVKAESKKDISFDELKLKIDNYGEGYEGDLHSLLAIFPETVDDNSFIEAHYAFENISVDGFYYFFLRCQYNEQTFNEEIERLENVKVQFETGNIRSLVYTESLFQYPAYLAIWDGYSTYEYALVDSSALQIIYITDQLFDFSELSIDESYLPTADSLPRELCDEGKPGYSIYYENGNDGELVIE